MSDLHLPWLELSIVIPLLGALCVYLLRDADTARRWSLGCSLATLCSALATWLDFVALHTVRASDCWHLMSVVFGHEVLVVDQLSAPLFSVVALLYFLTFLATSRAPAPHFSFPRVLISEAVLLATFSCQDAWGIVGLLTLGALLPYQELWSLRKPRRVYFLYMFLMASLLVLGQVLATWGGNSSLLRLCSVAAFFCAILIRSGIAPFHGWMSALFEHATFGTALLFTAPLVGAYAALRLAIPLASETALHCIAILSLATSVYAAGIAMVQVDVRRFFSYLLMSHSALVLVGLSSINPISITGALTVWLSTTLALGGLGLTLRALESRCGRVSLQDYQGLSAHTPNLAMFFLVLGLASVGFPGTFGFVGTDLLVDGVVESYSYVGIAVVMAAALNSIAVVRAFFLLFTGTEYPASVALQIRLRERYAILVLAALVLVGGLLPQPNIAARHSASSELLGQRTSHISDSIESVALQPSPKTSVIRRTP